MTATHDACRLMMRTVHRKFARGSGAEIASPSLIPVGCNRRTLCERRVAIAEAGIPSLERRRHEFHCSAVMLLRCTLRTLTTAALLSTAIAGCAQPMTTPTSTRPLGSGERWLRTIPPTGLCAGGGATVVIRLHGSAADPMVVWMSFPDGRTHQLAWPAGTSARFDPDLEVIGPNGSVVAREGDVVTGSCTIAPDFEVPEINGSSILAQPSPERTVE